LRFFFVVEKVVLLKIKITKCQKPLFVFFLFMANINFVPTEEVTLQLYVGVETLTTSLSKIK
jgi:hypothetical protein